MSTKHNPAKKSRKTPAVCRKGPVGLPSVYVAGLPSSLTCFAKWTETYPAMHIAESFRLQRDPLLAGWSGASGEHGLNLQVMITERPAKDTYLLELILRDGPAELDVVDWDNVVIAPGPPFNSGLLQARPLPPTPQSELHVFN